jgi:glutathione-dependent peroxiredoxin
MSPKKEGQRIPAVTFRTREAGQWRPLGSDELFVGKTVVLFALPGAFTPVCSSAHVPRFEELAPAFFRNGVDEIVCLSVNDAFVMDAWRAAQGVAHVRFVPDGNGDFTREMGMLTDMRDLGYGDRSRRYSMLVKDGVIDRLFVEPADRGDPYGVSDADTMLEYIAPDAEHVPEIVLFTRLGCSHCARARAMLDDSRLPYDEIVSTPGRLLAVSGSQKTPQVFVDGALIGGADELEEYLAGWRESHRLPSTGTSFA